MFLRRWLVSACKVIEVGYPGLARCEDRVSDVAETRVDSSVAPASKHATSKVVRIPIPSLRARR